MEFSEYQEKAKTTAIYPSQFAVIYPALGLAGEAGEVANKVKKVLRDSNGEITPDARQQIADEIGDVLWYAAAVCSDLGLNMGEIAQANIDKLYSRKERGVIGGSGDSR